MAQNLPIDFTHGNHLKKGTIQTNLHPYFYFYLHGANYKCAEKETIYIVPSRMLAVSDSISLSQSLKYAEVQKNYVKASDKNIFL